MLTAKLRRPIDLVEAAYDVHSGDEDWLGRVLRSATRELDAGFGSFAFLLDATPEGPRVVSPVAALNGDSSQLARIAGAHAEVPGEASRRLLSRDVHFGTLLSTFGGAGSETVRVIRKRMAPTRDAFGAVARGPGRVVFQLVVPSRIDLAVHPKVALAWRRVLHHVRLALRLRALVARKFAPAAAIAPDGKILHAEGDARGKRTREALQRAAVGIERARGGLRRRDPERAMKMWQGLVDGRWSLVDHWESDGHRYLAAYENPPDVVDVRAIPPWQRAIVASFLRGATVPEIAFALGYTQRTVARGLAEAVRALRFPSRVALSRVASVEALSHAALALGKERIDVLRIAPSSPTGEASRGEALTRAERDLVRLVSAGLSDKEIAARRGVSIRTVGNQLSRLYEKTGVHGRGGLARRVHE